MSLKDDYGYDFGFLYVIDEKKASVEHCHIKCYVNSLALLLIHFDMKFYLLLF